MRVYEEYLLFTLGLRNFSCGIQEYVTGNRITRSCGFYPPFGGVKNPGTPGKIEVRFVVMGLES